MFDRQGLQDPSLGPSHSQVIPSSQTQPAWFVVVPWSQVMHSDALFALAEPELHSSQFCLFQKVPAAQAQDCDPGREVEGDGHCRQVVISPTLYVLGKQGLQVPLLGSDHSHTRPSSQRQPVRSSVAPSLQVIHVDAPSELAVPEPHGSQFSPLQKLPFSQEHVADPARDVVPVGHNSHCITAPALNLPSGQGIHFPSIS